MDQSAPISRALAHPAIGRVLIAMYEDFARDWSITDLATIAGMSRASFAATFKKIVGETPARHLRRHRLARARDLIETTNLSQESIAKSVGYQSNVGLHLAFRTEFGLTPGALRRPDNARLHSRSDSPAAGTSPRSGEPL
ncbi:hypothetical protein GCM10029963_25300 [Micromonospora andamanensis]